MFRNRAVQVSLVKKNDATAPDAVEVKAVEPSEIAEIAKDTIVKTAIVIGCVFVASVVLRGAVEIAVAALTADSDE